MLFALVIAQAYWVVGTTFSADLAKHRDEFDGISGALRLRTADLAPIKDYLLSIENTNPLTKDNHVPIEGNESRAVDKKPLSSYTTLFHDTIEYDKSLSEWIESLDQEQRLFALATLDIDNKNYRICRVLSILRVEMNVLKWYHLPKIRETKSTDDSCQSQPPPSSNPKFNGYFTKLEETKERIKEISLYDLEHALTSPKVILVIVGQYLLPLLYGLLGSHAYILRTLSSEIRDVTFTRGSEIRYSLRWPLGMLAGVTVGLFFDPTHFSGFAAITPLGLAFLAGYGVELMFTGLDRIVRAFSSEDTARPKAA